MAECILYMYHCQCVFELQSIQFDIYVVLGRKVLKNAQNGSGSFKTGWGRVGVLKTKTDACRGLKIDSRGHRVSTYFVDNYACFVHILCG